MDTKPESPFKPGARVAVFAGYRSDYVREAFVEKVYKNGNFVLRGDKSKQQWRAYGGHSGNWSAVQTGSGYGRSSARIWDGDTDKQIRAALAVSMRREKLLAAQEAIAKLRTEHTTDEVVAMLHNALKKHEAHRAKAAAPKEDDDE